MAKTKNATTRKIKLLFDAGPLVNGNRTGVGRTTEGLVLALAQKYPQEIELVGHYFDFLGRKQNVDLPQAPNIRYRRTMLVPGKAFNMLRRLGVWIPFELLTKEKGDFHLFPGFIGWPSLFGTPNAPFVHDITYIDYPQYVNGPARFDLKTIMPRTLRRASFVITNSNSSKLGLLRAYPHLKNEAVLVSHIPGVNLVKISQQEAKKRLKNLNITQPYLLFFGTLEPRKNLVGLLNAYALLDEKMRQKYALVLGGGKGWHDSEIIATIDKLKANGSNVIQTGYVSDEDRAALFMQAAIYILPSHYEGFGMMLLEGMEYGSPMIASDIPVLREVAEDAAVYSGTSAADLATNITKLTKNEQLQAKLVAAGKKRLRDFSWDTVATDIFERIKREVL